MNIQEIKLKIGEYTLNSIPTGQFKLDGGAMFGTVPKVLWERTNPADEQNRILMESRALLIQSKDRKILVDNGNGSDFKLKFGDAAGEKFEQIYGVQKKESQDEASQTKSGNSEGSKSGHVDLISSLAKLGLKTGDITDVILTHLHFDHAGGSTCDRNGKLVPTFENATYYVQKENLATALNPNRREKASYLKANFEPLLEAKCLKTIDGPQELFPGVFLSLTFGHTHAQQNILVTDGTTSLFYCADLIPTATHTRLAWIMGYDLNPLKIIEEKNEILDKAAEDNWYMFFEHDPYCAASQVEFNGKDYIAKNHFNLV
jgi:glyoxylase-like metal-dependent hydrolase (beta-lactamase superfamily II)